MTTYSEWLENQTRIYNEIRECGRTARRFVPDPVAEAQTSGYLVAYTFSAEVERRVARIAGAYRRHLPLLGFGAGNAHSTILDFQVQPGGIDFPSEASQAIFRQLAEGVRRAIAEAGSAGAAVLYDEILHRDTTVIARGVPNWALWNLSDAICTYCGNSLGIRRGWGSHITVARVTAPMELPEPLPALPIALGEVRPEAIVVGTLDLQAHKLLCYERFTLP